jgi:rhodanese-related sulfurtransferase
MSEVILDVRERDEFEAEHVAHSINVPFSHFVSVAPGVLNQLTAREIVLLCRSGARAKLAEEQLRGLGFGDKVRARVYAGGILAWKSAGNPTITAKKNHLPLMRQVQLAAGILILVSVALGLTVASGFFALTAFVGAGLSVAGATGFCGMAILLSKMPWNRVSTLKEELCQVSPSGQQCHDSSNQGSAR